MMKVGSHSSASAQALEQLQLQAAQAARLDLLAETRRSWLEPVGIGQLLVGEAGVVLADGLTMVRRWKGLDRSSSRPWYSKDFGAQRLARGVAQQAFGEVHQRAVVAYAS
jgi:hypothetical protein